MKKKMFIGLFVIVVILLVGMGVVFDQTAKESNQLSFTSISLTEIEDGTYAGSASAGIVKAEVRVQVKDHHIMKIDIVRHEQGMGKNAEVIVSHMVDQNTTDVDVVSGATISSRVIRKAVETALLTGADS